MRNRRRRGLADAAGIFRIVPPRTMPSVNTQGLRAAISLQRSRHAELMRGDLKQSLAIALDLISRVHGAAAVVRKSACTGPGASATTVPAVTGFGFDRTITSACLFSRTGLGGR